MVQSEPCLIKKESTKKALRGQKPKRKDYPLKEYREKEAMTPAKEKEHEPTAVKREMTEKITEPGQTGTNPEEAREIARSKGMAKGTAGASWFGRKVRPRSSWIK